MRAGYRKRRKEYLPGPSGSATINKIKLPYFDALQFLKPYFEQRQTTSNVSTKVLDVFDSQMSSTVESDPDNRSESWTCNLDEKSVSDVELLNVTKHKKGNKKISNAKQSDQQMAEYLSILKEKHTKKKSFMEYFFLSLVEEVERLPLQKQAVFKIKVLELLNECGKD